MYCKYCGKRLDGSMDVCPECEEKLVKGENPFFSVPVYRDPVKELKNSFAAQNTPKQVSASDEQPGAQPEQNIVAGEQPLVVTEQPAVQPEQNAVNHEPLLNPQAYRSNRAQLPQQKKDFYGNGCDKSPYTAPSPYTSRSGIAFGVLSIVLPWAGLLMFMFALFVLLASGCENGMTVIIVLISTIIAPFVLAIVFGVKAINTFKKARTYGVKPVAALVLGIVGLASLASVVLPVIEIVPTI